MGIRWEQIRIFKKIPKKAKISSAGGYELAFFLVTVSIAVNRHHNHGSSYERKCLVGVCLEFQRFSLILLWWHANNYGLREGAESSTV